MRLLLLTIFSITVIPAFAQGVIRPEVNKLVDSIIADEEYNRTHVVSYSFWETFLILKKNASNEDLRQLTAHPDPFVRCVAFETLAERSDTSTFSILVEHLSDSEYVNFFDGCMGYAMAVGDFFIEQVSNNYPNRYALTSIEKQQIDSILLFNPDIHLHAKRDVLERLKPERKYYQRVRQLAEEGKYPVAIVALARFKNADDVERIKEFFSNPETEYYAIYACREFPHKNFYPELLKIFDREWEKKTYRYSTWRILYQALAQYDTQQTLKLFERTIRVKNWFRKQTLGTYLMIAITRYPKEQFEALKPKIKLDEYHIHEVSSQMYIGK